MAWRYSASRPVAINLAASSATLLRDVFFKIETSHMLAFGNRDDPTQDGLLESNSNSKKVSSSEVYIQDYSLLKSKNSSSSSSPLLTDSSQGKARYLANRGFITKLANHSPHLFNGVATGQIIKVKYIFSHLVYIKSHIEKHQRINPQLRSNRSASPVMIAKIPFKS